MGWIEGLTRNVAELSHGARDRALRPVMLAMEPGAAVEWAAGVIAGLPRWAVVAVDGSGRTLHATHTTRIWRFVDDVHIRFEPAGGCTVIRAASQSRVGKGDLGQNGRNLKMLTTALRAAAGDQVR
jgi:uncharacterized protein (DUF1499 family)